MALESFHTTPPDASFTGTGSAAWVAAHALRMEGGGFLVGRETAGTGAPESIAVGSNLTLSGGTLSAAGGTGAAGVSLVEGVAPILVTGTSTSTVALATSGVTAGTYGGALVIPRFDISAQGLVLSGTNAGTLGTFAGFNSFVSVGDVLGTSPTNTFTAALSTTGVAAGTYGTGGTVVPQVSVDAKGRILSVSNVGITFPTSTGGGISALAGDVLGTSTTGTLTSALSTTGVTAGTYGGTAGIPRFGIDAKGRVLAGANHPLEGSAPIAITTGAGTFVVSHNTSGVAAGTFGTGNDLVQLVVDARGHLTGVATSGTIGTMGRFSSYTMAGAALGTSTTGTMTVALSTTGVIAGTYGGATNVGQFTVDAGGRITLATNVNIAGAGTLAVIQGTTTVSNVNRLVFTTNATVTSTAAGEAQVAVTGGTGGGSGSPTFPGGIPLTGVKYVAGRGAGLATGDNDLYTVPAGKRAYIGAGWAYNSSAGNIVWYAQVKIGGTYYRLNTDVTTNTGNISNVNTPPGYIAEAGEILSINSTTNNGLNISLTIVEFDDSCRLFSSKLTSLSAGDNTVYTCPSSTAAILIAANTTPSVIGSGLGCSYVNTSGGARTVQWHIVASGQAVGANYRASVSSSISNNVRDTRVACSTGLASGDFININTDAATATQMAWVNVMEIAA